MYSRLGHRVTTLQLDSPVILQLRSHLLRLAKESILPQHGGRRVHLGSPEEDAVMERFRPFAELLLLVAAADGVIEEVERAVILGAFRAITGGRVRSATLNALEEKIQVEIAAGQNDVLLERVCTALARDKRDAELALTLASAVALADKVVDPNEVELIRTLASWLSITPVRVGELLSTKGVQGAP
jgi:tellurite resistance protein